MSQLRSYVQGLTCVLLTAISGASLSSIPDAGFCRATAGENIPAIARTERSDWINVKTDVVPQALGNGVSDDTAALQKALDGIGEVPGTRKVVYLPPGKYRITHTLSITKRNGGMLIGHGSETEIIWDGPVGGRMLWSNGAARQTYDGMIWDGKGKAGVGIDHDSKTLYETRVLHENMEFRNFRMAGIRVGHDQKLASAEMLFSNLVIPPFIVGYFAGGLPLELIMDTMNSYATEYISTALKASGTLPNPASRDFTI